MKLTAKARTDERGYDVATPVSWDVYSIQPPPSGPIPIYRGSQNNTLFIWSKELQEFNDQLIRTSEGKR